MGRSASARSLATRSLAFKMNVLYFDVQEVKFSSDSLIYFYNSSNYGKFLLCASIDILGAAVGCDFD